MRSITTRTGEEKCKYAIVRFLYYGWYTWEVANGKLKLTP